MANWIVGGIVFAVLAIAAWRVVKNHKKGECSGCCSCCNGCKSIR